MRVLKIMLILIIAGFTLKGCGCRKPKPQITPPPKEEIPAPKTEELKPPPPEVPKRVELNLQRIHFEYDKAEIRTEDRAILSQNGDQLKANSSVKVLIEGHCDERGTNEYNMALGERRAKVARDYLVKYGINQSRLDIISYGEEKPLDPRNNEEAWSANRRDEFVIIEQ